MDRTTSLASGLPERMKDSVQQVHSRPCSQITGVRGLVSSAYAILPANSGPRPRPAAVRLQNLRKLRRVMPCWRMTSYNVSRAAMATSSSAAMFVAESTGRSAPPSKGRSTAGRHQRGRVRHVAFCFVFQALVPHPRLLLEYGRFDSILVDTYAGHAKAQPAPDGGRRATCRC